MTNEIMTVVGPIVGVVLLLIIVVLILRNARRSVRAGRALGETLEQKLGYEVEPIDSFVTRYVREVEGRTIEHEIESLGEDQARFTFRTECDLGGDTTVVLAGRAVRRRHLRRLVPIALPGEQPLGDAELAGRYRLYADDPRAVDWIVGARRSLLRFRHLVVTVDSDRIVAEDVGMKDLMARFGGASRYAAASMSEESIPAQLRYHEDMAAVLCGLAEASEKGAAKSDV